jgi:hypothetical protein
MSSGDEVQEWKSFSLRRPAQMSPSAGDCLEVQ